MSMTDDLIITYIEKHNHWIILQGRETFYDEDRYMRTWDGPIEAMEWAKKNYPDKGITIKSGPLGLKYD